VEPIVPPGLLKKRCRSKELSITKSFESFSVFQADRMEELWKFKGEGICFICFLINNKWCNPKNIKTLSRSCSPNLGHLMISCSLFYLLWEFSMVIITAVYIPLLADTDTTLCVLPGDKELDHCYTPFKRSYKTASPPPDQVGPCRHFPAAGL